MMIQAHTIKFQVANQMFYSSRSPVISSNILQFQYA